MGSPDFAVPTLQALIGNAGVVGVVTQPDRPAGRGRGIRQPPVKTLALEAGIPVIQPEKLSAPEAMQALERWAPEVIVVAAFGQILKPPVLDLPRYGCLNVHASLLPRWRGASPVQAALLAGDDHTGATIIKMDPGVDTGPILAQRSTPVLAEDTGASLTNRLAQIGAVLLSATLPAYLSGKIDPRPQDDSAATYARLLKKSDGELDLRIDAQTLARQVRAYDPWPGSFLLWNGTRLKVHGAHATGTHSPGAGCRIVVDGLPGVGTGSGILILDLIQLPGRKTLLGAEFLKGRRDWGEDDAQLPGIEADEG